MNNKIILALDQGSSSSRVLAFDGQGKVVARSSRALDTLRPSVGLAEFDAGQLLQGQVSALQEVLQQTAAQEIAAISVATQRSTVVFWDRLSGNSLAPALSWQDGRAQQETAIVNLPQEAIHQMTGLYKTPFYSAPKIMWTLKNVPQVRQAAEEGRLCIGPVGSYIIWHLTGGKVFACDPTLAQRTLLFNISTLNWDHALLEAFGVKREWLPQLKRTVDDYGFYEYQGRHIPICACVGDQQASLRALRVVSGGACINYGTGAFFMRNTGHQCHFLPGLLTSVGAQDSSGCEYLLEGPVNACSTLFAWLNEIGFSCSVEEIDVLCEKATQPVQFLPALGGLGAPYWDFSLSPVLSGFSPRTQKADVLAGVVDGLAALLADIIFYAERYGIKSTEIKVSGGLSKSRALLRAQADILQMRLLPCVEAESTAAGAAMLAAQGVGADTSQWETLHLLPPVEPTLDPDKAEEKYIKWHQFLDWCKTKK